MIDSSVRTWLPREGLDRLIALLREDGTHLRDARVVDQQLDLEILDLREQVVEQILAA